MLARWYKSFTIFVKWRSNLKDALDFTVGLYILHLLLRLSFSLHYRQTGPTWMVLYWCLLPTLRAVAGGGGKVFTSVCLCVCFFRTISQTPMQLGSPNVPRWILEVHLVLGFLEVHLFWGSKGQRSRLRVTKTFSAWVFALLWVLVSSDVNSILHLHNYYSTVDVISLLHVAIINPIIDLTQLATWHIILN